MSVSAAASSLTRHRSFVRFWCARTFTNGAYMMQGVAVGWQIYALTNDPLDLGLVGLVQFFPLLATSIIAGQVLDLFDRRMVAGVCQVGKALAALAKIGAAPAQTPASPPPSDVRAAKAVVSPAPPPAGSVANVVQTGGPNKAGNTPVVQIFGPRPPINGVAQVQPTTNVPAAMPTWRSGSRPPARQSTRVITGPNLWSGCMRPRRASIRAGT